MNSAAPPAATPVSLRRNFVWTAAGNIVYGAGQWAILSLIAKLGNPEMLGQYALALAVATPAAMLSHLNLRAVLATDVARRHGLGDYVAVRMFASAVAMLAIGVIAFASGYSHPVPLVIVLLGLALSSENVSDTYYGAMQRRERMDQVARSMMARAVVSGGALGIALWITRDLVWAAGALALGRIAVLLVYDRRCGIEGEHQPGEGLRSQYAIFRTALPLGVALMLVALASNVPRYAVEHYLGLRELGAFAAAASFLTAGAALVNALGQSALPRLARHFNARELDRFWWLTLRLIALSAGIGLAGVVGAALMGGVFLRVLYRAEYAVYQSLFVTVMIAAVFNYAATMLGYALTGARAFGWQVPQLCAVVASAAAASWLLVARIGLHGGAIAIAIASCVQMATALWILRRTIAGARA